MVIFGKKNNEILSKTCISQFKKVHVSVFYWNHIASGKTKYFHNGFYTHKLSLLCFECIIVIHILQLKIILDVFKRCVSLSNNDLRHLSLGYYKESFGFKSLSLI